jgi:enolase
MFSIKSIKAREILDSRGNPTVEVEMFSSHGDKSWAQVPSGASTGSFEAHELRDGDPKRYHGKGVLRACQNINKNIKNHVLGLELGKQKEFDELLLKLDKTSNKTNLGANAILACSLAYARLSAVCKKQKLYQYLSPDSPKLPTPMFNLINGGKHGGGNIDIQEFMIVPHGIKTFKEQYRAASEIFHTLKKILKENGYSTAVGDEGGFAPGLESNFQALDLLSEAVDKSGYKLDEEISFALDVAASEMFSDGKYSFDGNEISSDQLQEHYEKMMQEYPMISIEDPFHEGDWSAWSKFKKANGENIQIVGDDLTVTNPDRIKKAIQEKAINSTLIKLNQIGTLTETLEAIKVARADNQTVVISHRSGETEDNFIADFAAAIQAEYIKTGSVSRIERIAKYNQLLRIEECL